MDNTYGTQEVKIVDRSSISLNGVNKIVSFDDEEFLMETVMGNLRILGSGLELLKLDTIDGNVKIKGKINSFMYIDDDKTAEREYKPFYDIKDMYPRYLFLLDLIIKDNIDGIKNVNIAKFIANNQDL